MKNIDQNLITFGIYYKLQPNTTGAPMKFIKYTIVWISQNLAIPFWVVGHIHLSIHSFHALYELIASVGMNLIVLTGFIIDYKAQNNKNGNQKLNNGRRPRACRKS